MKYQRAFTLSAANRFSLVLNSCQLSNALAEWEFLINQFQGNVRFLHPLETSLHWSNIMTQYLAYYSC